MIRRFLTRRAGASATGKGPEPGARRSRRRLAVEALEHRTLLSFAGSLRQVSALYGDDVTPADASSPNGISAAVWTNSNLSTGPRAYGPIYN
jgi:hypothetical protein